MAQTSTQATPSGGLTGSAVLAIAAESGDGLRRGLNFGSVVEPVLGREKMLAKQ
jgi:hypothetical protein